MLKRCVGEYIGVWVCVWRENETEKDAAATPLLCLSHEKKVNTPVTPFKWLVVKKGNVSLSLLSGERAAAAAGRAGFYLQSLW